MRDIIIGCDPGSRNFSISVIAGWDCLGTEMLKESIQNMRVGEYHEAINRYEDRVKEILDFYNPRLVCAERFIVRGFGANTVELVGIMLGIMYSQCRLRGIDVKLISAGQWKTKVKKIIDLKQTYKQYKKSHKIEPHTIDSLCIARFALNKGQFTERDTDWLHHTLTNLIYGLTPRKKFAFKLAKSQQICYTTGDRRSLESTSHVVSVRAQ